MSSDATKGCEMVEVDVQDDCIKGKWCTVSGQFHSYLVVDGKPGMVVKIYKRPKWFPLSDVRFIEGDDND